MNKNNKGFMLVEVIVTSTVIATAMISLYSTFNKLYTSYNQKTSYHNIDGIYATKTTINYLLDNDFNVFINNTFTTSQYKILIDDTTCFNNTDICNAIKSTYNVNKMIIAEYNKSIIETLKNTSINQTFKEYIDYVIGYYGIEQSNNKYNYIILTEIKDGDNYYYANLGIE